MSTLMLWEACLATPFTVNDFETSLNEMTVGETAFAPIGSGEVALFNDGGHDDTPGTKVAFSSKILAVTTEVVERALRREAAE
ncbi:hypothetical protein PPS11_22864 [Pseudomonas putida S11]|nr:hypothetical protein PPS11_22864 [Pseudomonas putida S11]